MVYVGRTRTRNPASGFSIILGSTAFAGLIAYVVTWLVPRVIGLDRYAVFAVFWSSIYLIVGALFGVQQEVTRGTREHAAPVRAQVNRARNFGAVATLAVFATVIATAPLWQSAVFPHNGWSLVWPLAVGTAGFVLVAVLCGTLYGLAEWRLLAAMMLADAVMRLLAIIGVLVVSTNVVALAWAVAAPFPLTVVLLWSAVRRAVVGRSQLDVGYRALTWNVARTVVAAASTGMMVSGFPLILGLTSHGEPAAIVGLYILTITLTRAPLVVVAMSLQSYFIVRFKNSSEHFWRDFLRIQLVVAAAGLVLFAAGWTLGPAVFVVLFPNSLRPDGWFIALLVVSSVLLGSLCVSAPAVLAKGKHVVYTSSWVVSAAVTVAALLLPLDFTTRTLVALLCGPAAGLLVNAVYLALTQRSIRQTV